jgi:GGDEF domain-containing protein
LLKQFSTELRSACRATDVIGRWGGDEFILLFDCALAEAEGQTVRLRKWICGNYTVRGKAGEVKLRVDGSLAGRGALWQRQRESTGEKDAADA